jgi:hypothetical protein
VFLSDKNLQKKAAKYNSGDNTAPTDILPVMAFPNIYYEYIYTDNMTVTLGHRQSYASLKQA